MKKTAYFLPLAAILAATLALFGISAALSPVAARNARAEQAQRMAALLPGSRSFTPEPVGDAEQISAAYRGEGGYVVETHTTGYAGELVLWVGVRDDGRVTGLMVRKLAETWGLGRNALHDRAFLGQFVGGDGNETVGETVDAITGATVTSKAVARGVNAAVAYVTGADTYSGATEWGG